MEKRRIHQLALVARRQAKVILVQWSIILALIVTVIVLAVCLSAAHAEELPAEYSPTEASTEQPETTSERAFENRPAVENAVYTVVSSEPERLPEPCPISEEEIIILAKVLYRECRGLVSQGTQFGVSYRTRQAAVAWCALNRLDNPDFPDTLEGVLTYPYAFAYIEDTPVMDELLWLADDVVSRWWAEKQGNLYVGRVLPDGYLFFSGDGKENYFRDNFNAPYTVWDWSLGDPYKDQE